MVTIIYCRYSSDMQRPESCADQERKVREYLLRNNIPSSEIVVCKDEAVSGTKESREAYDRIVQMISRREPFLLAVDDQSRLSRGDDVKGLIRDLRFAGGRFISAGENVDTAQDGWELKVGIMEIHNSLTITPHAMRHSHLVHCSATSREISSAKWRNCIAEGDRQGLGVRRIGKKLGISYASVHQTLKAVTRVPAAKPPK